MYHNKHATQCNTGTKTIEYCQAFSFEKVIIVYISVALLVSVSPKCNVIQLQNTFAAKLVVYTAISHSQGIR